MVTGLHPSTLERAQTPYQRLLGTGVLSQEQEARLAALYAATNPRQLRQHIYRAIAQLWQQADQGNEAAVSGLISK